MILPKDERPGTLVIYDLRDDEAWRCAHQDRRVWGKALCDFYVLDSDHVILLFRPGGAMELEASA